MNTINIEEFAKLDIRIGTVLEAIKVPEADRLLQLIFDFGPAKQDSSAEQNAVIASEAKQSSSESKTNLTPTLDPRLSSKRTPFSPFQEEREIKENPSTGSGNINYLPELVEKYPGRDVRQIMSAIAPFIPDPSVLVGKQIAVVTNLEPRKFKGYISQGMIMATDDENGIVLITPERKVEPGSKIH